MQHERRGGGGSKREKGERRRGGDRRRTRTASRQVRLPGVSFRKQSEGRRRASEDGGNGQLERSQDSRQNSLAEKNAEQKESARGLVLLVHHRPPSAPGLDVCSGLAEFVVAQPRCERRHVELLLLRKGTTGGSTYVCECVREVVF